MGAGARRAGVEDPRRYDLPCLWPEPIAVDRPLPLETPFAWHEYELTVYPFPGHSSTQRRGVRRRRPPRRRNRRPVHRRRSSNTSTATGSARRLRQDGRAARRASAGRLHRRALLPARGRRTLRRRAAPEAHRVAELHDELLPDGSFGEGGFGARIEPYRSTVRRAVRDRRDGSQPVRREPRLRRSASSCRTAGARRRRRTRPTRPACRSGRTPSASPPVLQEGGSPPTSPSARLGSASRRKRWWRSADVRERRLPSRPRRERALRVELSSLLSLSLLSAIDPPTGRRDPCRLASQRARRHDCRRAPLGALGARLARAALPRHVCRGAHLRAWARLDHGCAPARRPFAVPGAPLGHVSGTRLQTLFTPNPEDGVSHVRPLAAGTVIGVVGDGEPGRGRWLFTPAPLVRRARRRARRGSTSASRRRSTSCASPSSRWRRR